MAARRKNNKGNILASLLILLSRWVVLAMHWIEKKLLLSFLSFPHSTVVVPYTDSASRHAIPDADVGIPRSYADRTGKKANNVFPFSSPVLAHLERPFWVREHHAWTRP